MEVKCPYSLREGSLLEAINSNTFYVKNINGIYKLDTKHCYYAQIQMEMLVTNVLW